MNFRKEITTVASEVNDHTDGTIVVATLDTELFCNIYLRCSSTLNANEAMALRDALIEAYPLPKHTSEPVKKGKRPHGKQEYKGNGKHTWEDVTGDYNTRRLRVPGGWMYASHHGLTFVPVPDVVGYAV